MLLFFFLFLGVSSAFPYQGIRSFGFNFQLVQAPPTPPPPYCIPSPLIGRICLPLTFLPLRTVATNGNPSCILIPLLKAYVIRVCPQKEETFDGEKLHESLKEEIMKEVEKEKELVADNANIEVKGGEVEAENFEKKENGVKSEEFKGKDKSIESKNKIFQVSKEIIEVSKANNSPFDSLENVSITSNLV